MIALTTELADTLTAQQWAELRGITEAEAKFITGQAARLQHIAHLAAKQEAGTLTTEEATRQAELKAAYVKVEQANRTTIDGEREAIIANRPGTGADPKRLAEQPDLIQRWMSGVLHLPAQL